MKTALELGYSVIMYNVTTTPTDHQAISVVCFIYCRDIVDKCAGNVDTVVVNEIDSFVPATTSDQRTEADNDLSSTASAAEVRISDHNIGKKFDNYNNDNSFWSYQVIQFHLTI